VLTNAAVEEEEKKNDQGKTAEEKKKLASTKLIRELKNLLAFLARSDKKYADPTALLKALVDEDGNPIEIGE
jgi:hypothetical protein